MDKGASLEHVFSAIELGSTLVQACADAGLKLATFHFLVARDGLRDRSRASQQRGRARRRAAGVLRHVERIIVLIEGGMSARAACASDPRFPSRTALRDALPFVPDLHARYNAALDRREDSEQRCIAVFDEIERRVATGSTILAALEPRGQFPDYRAFSRFLAAHPEYDARYRAAGRAREAGPNARGGSLKYSAAELNRAATDLLLDTRRQIAAKRLTAGGPHVQTLLRARFRDADLRENVETAMVMRRARLGIVRGSPVITAAIRTIAAPVCPNENDLWRLALNALPAGLDIDVRNDVAADICVNVLEGRLPAHRIAFEAKRFLAEHNRRFSKIRNASLDAPIADGSGTTFVDLLTAWA